MLTVACAAWHFAQTNDFIDFRNCQWKQIQYIAALCKSDVDGILICYLLCLKLHGSLFDAASAFTESVGTQDLKAFGTRNVVLVFI